MVLVEDFEANRPHVSACSIGGSQQPNRLVMAVGIRGQLCEQFENIRDEYVSPTIGGQRERVVGVAFGLFDFSGLILHARTRRPRQRQIHPFAHRHGFVGQPLGGRRIAALQPAQGGVPDEESSRHGLPWTVALRCFTRVPCRLGITVCQTGDGNLAMADGIVVVTKPCGAFQGLIGIRSGTADVTTQGQRVAFSHETDDLHQHVVSCGRLVDRLSEQGHCSGEIAEVGSCVRDPHAARTRAESITDGISEAKPLLGGIDRGDGVACDQGSHGLPVEDLAQPPVYRRVLGRDRPPRRSKASSPPRRTSRWTRAPLAPSTAALGRRVREPRPRPLRLPRSSRSNRRRPIGVFCPQALGCAVPTCPRHRPFVPQGRYSARPGPPALGLASATAAAVTRRAATPTRFRHSRVLHANAARRLSISSSSRSSNCSWPVSAGVSNSVAFDV